MAVRAQRSVHEGKGHRTLALGPWAVRGHPSSAWQRMLSHPAALQRLECARSIHQGRNKAERSAAHGCVDCTGECGTVHTGGSQIVDKHAAAAAPGHPAGRSFSVVRAVSCASGGCMRIGEGPSFGSGHTGQAGVVDGQNGQRRDSYRHDAVSCHAVKQHGGPWSRHDNQLPLLPAATSYLPAVV